MTAASNSEAPRFAPRSAPATVRFWSRVARTTDDQCWEWLGFKSEQGYGHYTLGGFPTQEAHRISFLIVCGEIPAGLVLDHLCRNRSCVNPSHLEPVTSGENSRRSPLVVRDACAGGHPYVEGSYYLDRGKRCCKECKKAQVAAYNERTGRSRATYVCPHCGETRSLTGRSKHLRLVHPEHYTPRQPSEGLTPERHQRRLAMQRARRAKAAEARRSTT